MQFQHLLQDTLIHLIKASLLCQFQILQLNFRYTLKLLGTVRAVQSCITPRLSLWREWPPPMIPKCYPRTSWYSSTSRTSKLMACHNHQSWWAAATFSTRGNRPWMLLSTFGSSVAKKKLHLVAWEQLLFQLGLQISQDDHVHYSKEVRIF